MNIDIAGGTQHTGGGNSDNASSSEHRMRFEHLNCKNFKSSFDYICERLCSVDMMCLSETWLKPHEMDLPTSLLVEMVPDKSFVTFSKSGMTDKEPDYVGRPFGGVSIICKEQPGLSYHKLDSASDRILAVGIYDSAGTAVHIVICVYMPYYSGNVEQTDIYINTLDSLQAVIDNYSMLAPVTIMGDFNVKLPMSPKLHSKWYKSTHIVRYYMILLFSIILL